MIKWWVSFLKTDPADEILWGVIIVLAIAIVLANFDWIKERLRM